MAVMTAENVVADIEPRKVNTRNGEVTIYDVVDTNGVKWVAWDRPLAEQAFALKGVPSIWKVDISQNGKFENKTLKEIAAKPSGGFSAALDTMEAQLGSGTSSGFPTEVKRAMIEEPTFKDRNIWRQTATKVAAHLQPGTELEFWTNVDMLTRFYETGEKPVAIEFQKSSVDDNIPF